VKGGENILIGAALSGVASVVCASFSLTVALIAGSHPPVYPYLTQSGNTAAAEGISLQVFTALIVLIGTTVMLACLVVRRPIWRPRNGQQGVPLSKWDMGWSLVLTCIVIGFSIRSLSLATSAIDLSQPIANSPGFSGLSGPLETLSIGFMIVTSWTYAMWCRGPGARQEDSQPWRLAWRFGRAVRAFSGK
jgi:multisubunit Na+/H+ antiporter MnhC subunit